MTTVAAPTPTIATPGSSGGRAANAFRDAVAVTGRNLKHWTRQPQLIVFSTIQPVMFTLLFNFVFGSTLDSAPGFEQVDYTDFLMAGIFAQTVAFGATQTGVGLAEDLGGGMIDRFKSLPMARSAVLVGRTTSDLVRNLFVLALLVTMGYIVGFNFQNGVGNALLALALVAAFGYAFSWIFAFVGLAVPNAESAQAASFLLVFPFTFASSAFVPTEPMPAVLRAFAENQPITALINAVRALAIGGPFGADTTEWVLRSLAWTAGLLAVFIPLAVGRYRRL